MKKRLAALALSIILAMGLTPMIAFAADGGDPVAGNALATQDATSYDFWVGGVEVTSANASDITGQGISGKVSYDAETRTLTLDGATITGSLYEETGGGYSRSYVRYGILKPQSSALTINLVGSNKVEVTGGGSGNYPTYYGIKTSGKITFTGDGALSVVNDNYYDSTSIACRGLVVDAGAAVSAESIAGSYNSTAVDSDGPITVKGALNASAHSGTQFGWALCAQDSLTIAEGAKVKAVVDHGNYGIDGVVVRGSSSVLTVNGYLEARAVGSNEATGIYVKTLSVGKTGEVIAASSVKALSADATVKLGSSKLKTFAGSSADGSDAVEVADLQESISSRARYVRISASNNTEPKANPMTVSAKPLEFPAAKVKKADRSAKASEAFSVEGAQGDVTYKVSRYVTKAAEGKILVSKGGKVTVKKGTKAGTYKLKVKVTASGDDAYEPGSKTVRLVVKVA